MISSSSSRSSIENDNDNDNDNSSSSNDHNLHNDNDTKSLGQEWHTGTVSAVHDFGSREKQRGAAFLAFSWDGTGLDLPQLC